MRLISRASAALLGAILVLSTFAIAPVLAVGPTTHFQIVLSATETAGVADSTVTVNARDATNALDTTFAGTISFSSSDGSAVLPANFSTLTSGTGTFSVTLKIAGLQSVTVTQDGAAPTGTANTTVNAAAATHLVVVNYTSPIVAGTSDGFDVSARDAFNNVDTAYAGTVHYSSTDLAATLPINGTLTNGQASYTGVILRTAGTQSITGTDTVTASITGSQTGIVVNPAAAATLSVTGYPSPTTAGVAHNVTVTARDAFNNVATGYGGTVHVTSSDGAATLPADNTLVAGTRAFSVTLNTVGAGRSITATDTVTSSITGSQGAITVSVGNVAPVANADSANVTTGSGYTAINVLANDTDANSDTLHVSSATAPAHGTVIIPGGGANITYRPTAGFVGTDTFTYKANDGALDSNSATVTVHVVSDATAPVATAPVQAIGGQIIGVSTVKVHLTWSGTDVGLGISKFELWQSTDGRSYARVLSAMALSANAQLTRNHTYRFRVRAIDKAGNVGAFAYGPTFKFALYQETSASYPLGWHTVTSAIYNGGSAKWTASAGRSAAIMTSGRTFAWIGSRGPNRGTADVFIDGILRAHVNLFNVARSYQRVIFSMTFASSATHVLRIVYTGPTTRRIDLDAIIVLR